MSLRVQRRCRIRHSRGLQLARCLVIGTLFQISLMLSSLIPSFSSPQLYGTDDTSPYFTSSTEVEALHSYASRPASNLLPSMISSFSSTDISPTPVKINVVNFGAMPNDGIDDTDAINRAISTVNSHHNTVFFPEGTYSIQGEIRLKPKMIIEGEGRDKSILQWTLRNITRLDVLSAQGTELVAMTDIVIQNLWINGTGINKMGSCIRLVEVVGYQITNTKLTNCGGDPNGGAVYSRHSENGEISYNVIDKTRNGYITPAFFIVSSQEIEGDAAPLNGTNSGIDQTLDDPGSSKIAKRVERIPGGSNNTLIAFNIISNSSNDAIHPQSGVDNQIIGNVVIDSHDDNIDTFLERNTVIQDNTVIMNFPSTTVTGFEIGDGTENLILKHNRVFGSSFGINVASDTLNFAPRLNRNITITGNEISESIIGCIRIKDAEYVNIIGNNFSKCNIVSTTMMTGQEGTVASDRVLNSTLAHLPLDQNTSHPGYGMVAESSSFLVISDNNIEYIGGRNSSSGISLRGSEFVNITSNHIGLALEETIWEGSGIFINDDSDHVIVENNDLSGCGCLVKVMSSSPDVQVSALEETTRVQAVRLPFSFTYQVPALSSLSSEPDGSGDTIHYTNYTISGMSAINVGSVQAIPSEHLLIVELDRNHTMAGRLGSADIEIPKQLMNKVSRVTAYSAEHNMTTAGNQETMSNNNDEPKVLVIEGSDELVLFAEHQSNQKVPFQRLDSGPNSNTIRLIVPEFAQRLEIKGTGGWIPSSSSSDSNSILSSLSSSQIGSLGVIFSVVGVLGGTLFILRRKENRVKRI